MNLNDLFHFENVLTCALNIECPNIRLTQFECLSVNLVHFLIYLNMQSIAEMADLVVFPSTIYTRFFFFFFGQLFS